MPRRCGIGNARDSAAGWASSEINCTAGWIERRPAVEMARPVIAIRRYTDERAGPDPRRQRACPRSPRNAWGGAAAQVYLRSSGEPRPAAPARVCAFSREPRNRSDPLRRGTSASQFLTDSSHPRPRRALLCEPLLPHPWVPRPWLVRSAPPRWTASVRGFDGYEASGPGCNPVRRRLW
jgi:hypothetical protein